MMSASVIEMAALSRPFQLGMLYDCRSDHLVPAITLWDSQDLQQNISETDTTHCAFDYVCGDSLEKKSKALNIQGSIQVSIISGLLKLAKGTGKYIQDESSTNKVSRVSFIYSKSTKHKQLNMEHMAADKIRHKDVFTQGHATHVVVGIQYGINAVFTFEQELKQNEDKQKIEASIEISLKKFNLEGQASLHNTQDAEYKMDNVECKYVGDMELNTIPKNIEEAKLAIRHFQDELAKGNNGVPVKVSLYPLHLLDKAAPMLHLDIEDDMIQRVQGSYQFLKDIETWCQDTIEDFNEKFSIENLEERIKVFQKAIVKHRYEFQKEIRRVIQSIRCGESQESELNDFVVSHLSAPYSEEHLTAWKKSYMNELDYLRTMTTQLDQPINDKSTMDSMFLKHDQILLFEILLPETDEFLNLLDKSSDHMSGSIDKKALIKSDTKNILENIKTFQQYSTLQNFHCMVTSQSVEGEQIQSKLIYYINGEESVLPELEGQVKKIKSSQLLIHYTGHMYIWDIAFMYDGTILLVAGTRTKLFLAGRTVTENASLYRINTAGEALDLPFKAEFSGVRGVATNNTTRAVAVSVRHTVGSTVYLYTMVGEHWTQTYISSSWWWPRFLERLALTPDNQVMAFDLWKQLVRFDRDSNEMWNCPLPSNNTIGPFVCLHSSGKIIVSTPNNNRISVFDNEGKELYQLPHDILQRSKGICCDTKGNLFVADAETRYIHQYSLEGDYIQKIVQCEASPLSLSSYEDQYLAVCTLEKGLYIYQL